jgi:hypothetical protein
MRQRRLSNRTPLRRSREFAEALSAAIIEGEAKPKADEAEGAPAGRIMLPAVVPPPPPLQPPKSDWDEAVAAMNSQNAIIENVGGKTVIASWEPSPIDLERLMVVFQSKEASEAQSGRWYPASRLRVRILP